MSKLNAIGLDIGTHMLVSAKELEERGIEYSETIDAFFSIDATDQSRDLLNMLGVVYTEKKDKIYVLGKMARDFAVMFKQNTRRPMQSGALNKMDIEAIGILRSLLKGLLGEGDGQSLFYSCTSQPLGTTVDFQYHKAQMEHILEQMGYIPKSIQEARAIALSELAKERFTGIAISCGAGTTTVWMGLLGMDNPNFQFSINRGGDYIDSSCAENFAGLTRTKVQTVKEKGIKIKELIDDLDSLDGAALTEARAKQALSIYYRDYIKSVVKSIKYKIEKEQLPEFDEPIVVVIAGGTSQPEDFIEVFTEEWNAAKISLDIKEIRHAESPKHAVAKGCLIAAQLEERRKDG